MSVSIRNLNIVINGMPIVHDVDMDIADGERVGLIGSSGSGKSMIAKSIMGLLPLSAQVSGSIDMGGTEIVGASDQAIADLRGRYVGMVFQNPSAALNPVMTVAQQVALPLRLHYDLTRDERLDRVKAMFAKVRLPEDVLNKYPHELSGGQQQRVGIAAALVTSPRLIIATSQPPRWIRSRNGRSSICWHRWWTIPAHPCSSSPTISRYSIMQPHAVMYLLMDVLPNQDKPPISCSRRTLKSLRNW